MTDYRKRILVLTPRFPYPVIGGDRLRIHAICKALSDEYSLTLLSLCEKHEFDPALVTDGIFDHIERIYLPKWQSIYQVLSALPTQRPLQIAYYASKQFSKRLRILSRDNDLILAHLIRTGDYVTNSDTLPTVLEMTDAISMNYARVRERGTPGLRGRIYSIEADRLRRYERRMSSSFSAISLIADADATYLWNGSKPDNLVIATNGVDCDALGFIDRSKNPRIAVFIGNMFSAQNMDACRHFVTDILPQISESALTEFRIVGRIHDHDAVWLRKHSRVTVTGEVTSIPDVTKDARFGICSVRIGAGVQNKILEYMALGLPVISSPLGHEGIDATSGRDILIADTPHGFADQIMRLNEDESLFQSISTNGYNFVRNRHSWQSSLSPLVECIRNLIST